MRVMGFEAVDLGHPDANRAVNMTRALLDDSPPQWWYLSFTDPDTPPADPPVPGGPSWLGACYVKASNIGTAVMEAHRLGCNPGGQVAGWGPLTDEDMDVNVPEEKRNRLLSLDEVDA